MLEHINTENNPPKRVVIIGGSGFVGHAVTKRLIADNVSALSISSRDIDLLEPGAASKLGSILKDGDSVVAAAALAPCKNSAMLRDNMILAQNIIEALSGVPVSHVVNVSSDAVYADEPVPLTEDSPMAPDSLHGAMHHARELMFESAIQAPLAIVRPTLLYGADDPHNGYGPNRFRRLCAANEPITLFGNGEERRDHVLIDDAADLIVRILLRKSTGHLNIASGHVASFHDIAKDVVRISGKDIAIKTTERVGPMPHNGYRPFSTDHCRAAFPDFSYTPLEDGLAQAWAASEAA